jgi:hypothetical protein
MRGEGGVVDDDAAEMETDTDTVVEGVAGVAPEREGEVDGPARGTGRGRGGASMMARWSSVGVANKGALRALARGTFGEERKVAGEERVEINIYASQLPLEVGDRSLASH